MENSTAKEFYDRIEQCIDSKKQKKRLAGMVWPEDKSYENSKAYGTN